MSLTDATGMSQGVRDKRIAFSIARHLQSQASSGVLDEDGKEEVEGNIEILYLET